jgi:hypothetical protein
VCPLPLGIGGHSTARVLPVGDILIILIVLAALSEFVALCVLDEEISNSLVWLYRLGETQRPRALDPRSGHKPNEAGNRVCRGFEFTG